MANSSNLPREFAVNTAAPGLLLLFLACWPAYRIETETVSISKGSTMRLLELVATISHPKKHMPERGHKRNTHSALHFETLEPRQMLAAATGWEVTSPGGGGALFAPSINPLDPAEMYVYSDMSQVYRTQDSGQSWTTVDFDQLGGSSRQPQVQFTNDPDIQFAIDFAAIDQLDAAVPVRSSDGGETWQHLTDPTGRETFYLFADFDHPDRLIVTDWTKMYFSTDGGQSYSVEYTAPSDDGLHIAGVFFDGQDIYVGTNHGLLQSSDGGQSFALNALPGFAQNEDMVTFAGAKENGVVRLYAVAQDIQVWGGYQASEWWDFTNVYKMDVGQTNWTSINSNLPADSKPYFVDLAANDVDTLYVAGNDENGLPLIYKSDNGGQSWNDVFRWKNNENIATGWQGEGGQIYWWWGSGALGFDVDRNDAENVLVTDLGFAHLSDNGGNTWRNVNVHPDDLNAIGELSSTTKSYRTSGLGNTANWDLTWLDANTILAGFSDIEAAISYDGGESWSFDYTGLGQNSLYRSQVHPDTGIVYGVTSTVHDVHEVTRISDTLIDAGEGKVVFSENQGKTWQTLHDFGKVVRWIELDPTHPNRAYISVVHSTEGGLYVTNNLQQGANATWQKLTDPPRTEGHPNNIQILDDGSLLTTFSARIPGQDGAFTASSGVFLSNDGGQTWLDRTDARMQYWTQDITVDPHDPSQNTWYAGVYSGWGGPPNDLGGLYRTQDRGQTWERFYQSHRVSSATISPTNPDELYLTTESEGLIFSGNRNAANPTFNRVEGVPFRHPKQIVFNPHDTSEVWVTTFGGQLWVGHTGELNTGGHFSTGQKLMIDNIIGDPNRIIVSQTPDDYRFILQTGVWNGTDSPSVRGGGTSVLLVDRQAAQGFELGIELRDTSHSDYDLFFQGDLDFTGVANFSTYSIGNITQQNESQIRFDRAVLDGLDIFLDQTENDFDQVTVNGAEVELASSTGLVLRGDNSATALSILTTGGRVRSLSNTHIQVTHNFDLVSDGRVDLARTANQTLNVGRRARFDAGDQTLSLGREGTAHFGWLWVQSAGQVRINEASSTHLVKLNSQKTAVLTSNGTLTDAQSAAVNVTQNLTLSASGEIDIADGASHWQIGGHSALHADDGITVSKTGLFSTRLLSFQTPKVANLHIDGNLFLHRNSVARYASLVATKGIYDTATAKLDVQRNLTLHAETGITLADRSENVFRVGGIASLHSSRFIVVREAGQVEIGRLNFTSRHVNFSADSRIHLLGVSSARRLILRSATRISDAPTANLSVIGRTDFIAAGVYLDNSQSNEYELCGNVRFDVEDYAVMHDLGLVKLNSYWVTPSAFQDIHIDSAC